MAGELNGLRGDSPNYNHDEELGHRFYAITSKTDRCEKCGCTVSESSNGLGANGVRFDEKCPVN